MQAKTLRTSVLVVLGIVILIIIYKVQFSPPDMSNQMPAVTSPAQLSPQPSAENERSGIAPQPLRADSAQPEREAFKQEMIQKLLTDYREVIKQIAVQVKLIDLRTFVIQAFPEGGLILFEEIIRGAFPELADAIFAALARMDQYDQWLLDNMRALNELPLLERNGRIWEQRTQLFGEHAKAIWSDELDEAQQRYANMQKSLELLSVAYDVDLNERLYLLTSTMNEYYANTPEGMMFGQGMLGKVFFGFDSVQKDLSALTPELRQEQIDSIRRTLGYTEEQIARAAEQDQEKERRWQNGYQYMTEREALMSANGSDELEQELAALREKYFKAEAKTIALEEQDGFFRFNRPRLYGRN